MKPAIDVGTTEQITANFKAAGQLVKKQALRAKLVSVDLPKALASLGKYVYDQSDSKTRYSEQCRVIDGLKRKIEDLATAAKGRPAAEGVAAKAQGLIKGAGDLAQRKLIENQLGSAFAKLGEAASTHDIPGAEPMLKAVSELKSQVALLDSEISSLSQMAPAAGWVTPKRIVFAGAALIACAMAAIVLRPSDEYSEKDPFENEKKEHAALGAALTDRLRQGDALWDKQDCESAVAIYAEVIEKEKQTFGHTTANQFLPRPMGRLVDHVAEKGGEAAAVGYAKKALDEGVTPLVMTAAGSKALEAAKRADEAEEAEWERERELERQRERAASAPADESNSDEYAYREGYALVSDRLARVRSAPPGMKRSLMQAMQKEVETQQRSKPRAFSRGAADAMKEGVNAAMSGR